MDTTNQELIKVKRLLMEILSTLTMAIDLRFNPKSQQNIAERFEGYKKEIEEKFE